MLIERFSLLPPSPYQEVQKGLDQRQHAPRVRFEKAGENADHPATVRMRSIKRELRLTTRDLVSALKAYEAEFPLEEPNLTTGNDLNANTLSAYLQGRIVNLDYLDAFRKRIERFYAHSKTRVDAANENRSIRSILDRWFDELHIEKKNSRVSPYRELGKLIGPFYKRPVLSRFTGLLSIGHTDGGITQCVITDEFGEKHEFRIDAHEPILIDSGKKVKAGDVLQYSVLMHTEKKKGGMEIASDPSLNHTTFFRWYKNDRMPAAAQIIERLQEAVNEAAKRMNSRVQ